MLKKHLLYYQVYLTLRSLTNMINASNFTTCISLNNQPCMTRTTLVDLNSDEYNYGFCDYPFIVNLLVNLCKLYYSCMTHKVKYVFQTKQ